MVEENIALRQQPVEQLGKSYLPGMASSIRRVYRQIEGIAESTSPVLICGETGAGKGMLARYIHCRSKRRDRKFIPVNCGAVPDTLLESELFGYKKGAFTGANVDKKGLLEEAEGGTVLLDEIGDTSPAFQAKVLEAIDDKTIRRLGETGSRRIDVRFLFATNQNLEDEVKRNRFRIDLYYRVNVHRVDVPPLRKRKRDIPSLAKFFLGYACAELNKNVSGFTPQAVKKLTGYSWPGNIRELQHVMNRAAARASDRLITAADLGLSVGESKVGSLAGMKRDTVVRALVAARWNMSKAARDLQIGRRTLYRCLEKYGLKRQRKISKSR
jgi:transcriptional regulator with GAF, ATPase, and Fis domain